MSTKPSLTGFNRIGELFIHKYERYLPTAFDDSLSLLDKVNKTIEYMNQVGALSNNVVDQWNEVMEWTMNDGLTDATNERLDEFAENGTLDTIINHNIFNELNVRVDSKSSVIVSKTAPTNPKSTTVWYQDKGSSPISL